MIVRMLLALMLATFLSPGFAWHMNADHRTVLGHMHDHDDDPSHADDDSHADAHASIGHMLGHLSMQAPQTMAAIPVLRSDGPSATLLAPPPVSGSSPPYKPPL